MCNCRMEAFSLALMILMTSGIDASLQRPPRSASGQMYRIIGHEVHATFVSSLLMDATADALYQGIWSGLIDSYPSSHW